MVTGAGGSIGSELCRQIVSFGPASLALVDRYENSLHWISVELEDQRPRQDHPQLPRRHHRQARLGQVFRRANPQIVFHAAAHKHVPMVEMNPSEGFKNNVSARSNWPRKRSRPAWNASSSSRPTRP